MDERTKAIDSAVRNFAGTWQSATAAYDAGVAAERERWRLRVLGLQAHYDDPACRAALKHAAAYGSQDAA